MESMTSIAPSVGSTTAMGLEDDANNFSMVQTRFDIHDEDHYSTPKRTSSLPACGSTYEPECDDSLQPSIGMRFDSWEAGLAFYRMYAHEVGFSVRIWTQHKGEGGVIIWKKFVCARQGWRKKKSVDLGQVTQEVQRKKAKRNIKISRCGCEAMMGLKRQDDNKYEVVQFIQSHTHQLVSPSKRHLIRSNREVTSDLRNKLFTCSKALLGTSKTFRLLSIEKGGPENIGCTKRDLQNCQRDFKAAIKGADGQLIVDIMENKKKANPAFYFDYQVDENNKLTNIFWADSICRKNYSLFW